MALLSEYALIPDVFDSTSYSSEEIGRIHLQGLKEVLLDEGLVRDLRDGAWRTVFSDNRRPWHLRGKELLKKLVAQKRFRCCPPALPNNPTTDCEWCHEALRSHQALPMGGIVATKPVADAFHRESLVASIDRLSSAPWWADRSPSVRLPRTLAAYEENLKLVLQCANSVMFIDPHLDPSRPHYREFISLLGTMVGRNPAPLIEVHRVCYFSSGRARKLIPKEEWKSRFHNAWASHLQTAGLSVEVFIWDDFHDRYLISNLVGILMPNGFDTTTNSKSITRWTRLGKKDRDDVQREFDPAKDRHTIKYRFKVP